MFILVEIAITYNYMPDSLVDASGLIFMNDEVD